MSTFLNNISMVSRSATQYTENSLSDIGDLKGYQAKYILILCQSPGISQDTIARLLFVNKSNVARQVAALEELGYLERRQGEDRRISLVYPTQKAEALAPVLKNINSRWQEIITEGFTDEEKELLLSLTERLRANAARYTEAADD